MAGEREWVETVKADVEEIFGKENLIVETGRRLPYALYVAGYPSKSGEPALAEPRISEVYQYQTDLLIAERDQSQLWVPRVVVEFKFGAVTTHDALTYSAKAATHKNLHPYLRYGIVIGAYEGPIPRRLMRHGHQFDFMLTLASEQLTNKDRDRLINLLREELRASKQIASVLTEKSDVTLFHRRLYVSD